MGSSSSTDPPHVVRLRHQEVVIELGKQALETDDYVQLQHKAVAAVAESLDVEYCGLFEVRSCEDECVLRTGNGWKTGDDGTATLPTGTESQIGATLRADEPVVVEDRQAADRFDGSELLAEHGVTSGITVRIGSSDEPWGVLGAYTSEERTFREADCEFVQNVAEILASVTQTGQARVDRDEVYGRISDGFFALDEEWRFTYLNDRAHELINPDGRRLVDEHVWEAFPEAIGRKFRSKYEQAMYDQEAVSFEGYYPEPLDAWFEIRIYPSETGLSVYFRDVTERIERERKLEESEQRYRTLVEHFPNGAVALVNDELRYETIGGTPIDETGATNAELEGEPVREAWAPALAEEIAQGYEAALDGDANSFELQTADQVYDVQIVPIRDEDGDVIAALGISQNITERRTYQEEIERSEQRYRTLAEYFPNGLVTLFDHDLEYTLAAGQGFDRIPVEPDDLEGRTFHEVWPDETADALQPAFQAALAGEERSVELEYAGREWVVHAAPITDERGDVLAGMTMAQDITEQKERERYLRDAKSQLEAATEAGAVGTWEWDVRNDEMVVGPSFAKTFGVDPEAAHRGVSLDRFIDAIHENDRERVVSGIEAAVETCGEYESEYRVRNAEGETRWVVARGRVECDDDGEPMTFPGTLTDITDRKRAELERQRNQDQLETLFEVLPVGVVVADADGRLIDANDTAREIWGGDVFDAGSVSEYEKYSIRWADSGDAVAPEEMTMTRVLAGEDVREPDVFEIEAADGERRIIRVQGRPVVDEDGSVTRGVITFTDITERREYQQKLAESERRYRTLVEHFPNGAVCLFDEDLRYQIAGGETLEELGTDATEIVGQTIWERYPTALAERLEPNFEGALAGETNTFEVSFHDRDWLAHTLPVTDDAGDIFGGMIMLQNITDRKERERELEESERRYRTLVENFPEGSVGLFDDDLTYTAVGGQLLDEIGIDTADRVGNSVSDIYPDRLIEEYEPYFQAALEGEHHSFELELYDRRLYANTLPVRNANDDIFAGMIVVQDVTERREYQRKLEESNERLEQFAYAASHDLQEPLRMVTSYLTLLEKRYEDVFDEDGREFLEFAVDGAERMREMIDALLMYSRIETRGDPFEPTDLNAVLESVLEDLQLQIEESGAEVTTEELPHVDGDENQLRQVFQNLLSNAITYSGDEPPRVHVGADRRNGEWVISVRDEGIGIAPDNQERVFTIFDRLHSREEYDGMGIGLALCERIIERHGGEIWVDSEPGEGSTFSFTLPVSDDRER
ncbi:PAS domain-containing protein [Natrinema gelatinilyticum]|uniref:PAS domain-containing protein n=1 Tax=Natrinema gelatinilyticum TaxID=2961571 RepID=UPI0020C2A3A5|nr:PAS domain-containing protein [Natrinema gelatinilyticum]